MSIEACLQFEKLVQQKPELQRQLLEATDQASFIKIAVALGRQNQLEFTEQEATFLSTLDDKPFLGKLLRVLPKRSSFSMLCLM